MWSLKPCCCCRFDSNNFYSNCAKYFLVFSIGENPLQSFDRWKPLQYFNRQKSAAKFLAFWKTTWRFKWIKIKKHVHQIEFALFVYHPSSYFLVLLLVYEWLFFRFLILKSIATKKFDMTLDEWHTKLPDKKVSQGE